MGNQAIFDRAMEQNQLAVRQGDWGRALKEALRAMQEVPNNTEARIAVATALYHNEKLPQALQLFTELQKADPSNPIFMEYIARINQAQGDTDTAIDLFLQLADRQAQLGIVMKAVRAYREILEFAPDHEEARIRVAMILAQSGDKPGAIREFVFLGQNYLKQGNLEAAQDAVTEALNVDSNSLSAQELQRAIGAQKATLMAAEAPEDDGRLVTKEQIENAFNQAAAYREANQLQPAATLYEKILEALPDNAEIRYSLGLIYDELDRYDEALRQLEQAALNDEYALSSHFAMGSIFQKVGKLERAAQEYEQAIRFVDLQSIGKEESADLIDMYEATAAIYLELGDVARAASLYSTLAGFFQGKRWGAEQAVNYTVKAKELTDRSMMSKLRMLGTGFLSSPPPEPEVAPEPESTTETWGKIPSITDFLHPKREQIVDDPLAQLDTLLNAPADPLFLDPLDTLAAALGDSEQPHYAPLTPLDASDRPDRIQRLVDASAAFAEQGLLYAAIDACHEIIRYDQEFYLIHLRMAEILERLGRPYEAVAKLNLLIATYKARNEPNRAIDVIYRLIELTPDPMALRQELADLLRSQGRTADAAEQLAIVADLQFRTGQTMKTLELFRRALEWAPENTTIRSQYGQVLLKLERWEAALDEFRRVVQQNPNDIVALAHTNIALAMMGQIPDAIWDSTATLMQLLPNHPQSINEVQSEYRSISLIIDRPIIQFILGLLQQATDAHQAAILSFEQTLDMLAMEPDPLIPTVLIHQALADSFIVVGDAPKAIEQLQKIEALLATGSVPAMSSTHAFARPFNEGELHRRLAEAYAAAENYEGAIVALQKVKQLLPYDRAAYTKLADIYFRQGRLSEAMDQLSELATYYENQSQLDRAIETLQNALKLAPNNIPIKSRHAQIQLRRGYLDEGLASLDELAELQRKQGLIKDAVASIQQAADVYWTLGQIDKAGALYNRIVQIAPNDTEARQHLVSFNILSLRTRDAIEQLREIARLSITQRNYEEAIASLHQVIALDQKDADAYEQLADVLMRVNEYGQAVRVYKQLAKLVPDDERVEALQAAAQRMLDQQVANNAT